MWAPFMEEITVDYDLDDETRHTKDELEKFIQRLNFDIQYLGLEKDEVIEIVNSLYN